MFLDCSGGPTLPRESLEVKEDGKRVGQKDATTEKRGTRGGSLRGIQPTIACFEDGRREPAAKECRWPIEAENGPQFTVIKEKETPVLQPQETEFC